MGLFDKSADTLRELGKRVPPGQKLTDKFPVLTYGPVPGFDSDTWDFGVTGLVKKERFRNRQEFLKFPQSRITADFHCVTAWSRLDNLWEGVLVRDIISDAEPHAEARFVIVYCDGGYTTNVPLEEAMKGNVILAHQHDGKDLSPDHGFPLRLVVPDLYAWKSAKWVRKLELSADDKPGFWEQNGYHNDADPWKQQRVWGD